MTSDGTGTEPLRRGATRKSLFIKHLTKIRVVVFATLKMLNILTHKQLRGARLFNGKYRQSCRLESCLSPVLL